MSIPTYNTNAISSMGNTIANGLGAQAKNPMANTTLPTNFLPKNQTASVINAGSNQSGSTGTSAQTPTGTGTTAGTTPTTGTTGSAGGNTGRIGNPYALASYNGLMDIGSSESPEVTNARNELKRYQESFANADAGLKSGGTDFSYLTGTESALTNQYQQGLASRQNALSNALSAQGQKISALSGAGGLSAPGGAFGVPISNISGQPIVNAGSLGGIQGLAFQGGRLNAAQAQGANSLTQGTAITSARNISSQLKSMLSSSGLNQNQLALSNWVGNVVAANLSNPKLAPIQTAITNALTQYAGALGTTPEALIGSLTAQSGSQSISALLDSLDQQAYGNYQATISSGQGAGVAAPQPTTGQLDSTSAAILQKYGIQ